MVLAWWLLGHCTHGAKLLVWSDVLGFNQSITVAAKSSFILLIVVNVVNSCFRSVCLVLFLKCSVCLGMEEILQPGCASSDLFSATTLTVTGLWSLPVCRNLLRFLECWKISIWWFSCQETWSTLYGTFSFTHERFPDHCGSIARLLPLTPSRCRQVQKCNQVTVLEHRSWCESLRLGCSYSSFCLRSNIVASSAISRRCAIASNALENQACERTLSLFVCTTDILFEHRAKACDELFWETSWDSARWCDQISTISHRSRQSQGLSSMKQEPPRSVTEAVFVTCPDCGADGRTWQREAHTQLKLEAPPHQQPSASPRPRAH